METRGRKISGKTYEDLEEDGRGEVSGERQGLEQCESHNGMETEYCGLMRLLAC